MIVLNPLLVGGQQANFPTATDSSIGRFVVGRVELLSLSVEKTLVLHPALFTQVIRVDFILRFAKLIARSGRLRLASVKWPTSSRKCPMESVHMIPPMCGKPRTLKQLNVQKVEIKNFGTFFPNVQVDFNSTHLTPYCHFAKLSACGLPAWLAGELRLAKEKLFPSKLQVEASNQKRQNCWSQKCPNQKPQTLCQSSLSECLYKSVAHHWISKMQIMETVVEQQFSNPNNLIRKVAGSSTECTTECTTKCLQSEW